MKKVIVPVVFLVCAAVVLIVMLVESAPAQPAGPAVGLQVIASNPPVMFDPGSAKTWVLMTSTNPKRMAWVPIKRLDSDSDIEKWQITGKAREELEK